LKLKFNFTILAWMATVAQAVARKPHAEPASACPMTRCECAELPFEEIARRIEGQGLSVAEGIRQVGCGQICTACLPDLESYLKAL
jgi:NAD(P)H-nitrite reductase large subunit